MRIILGFWVLALVGFGCSQFADLEDAERSGYEAEFAVPLVNTSFTMNDVLENFEENSVLTVLPNGLLRLQYSGDVISESTAEVFDAINRDLSQAGFIPLGTSRQALPFTGPNGLEIDRMELKEGQLLYTLENCYDVPITGTITFPSVTLNGEPLRISRQMPAGDGMGGCEAVANALSPYNLKDHLVTPENDSVYVLYEVKDNEGNILEPIGNNLIAINGLAFSYTEGYLGQVTHTNDRDTIEIDFFDNWIRGDVYFEDPVITFNFENSFGIPTRSIIDIFDIFTVEGEVLPLESEFITNGVDFPYPLIDEVGQVKETKFTFTKDNSNIREVLGAGPVAIDYDVDAITNPDGDTEVRGFITDSSYYLVRVDVDLPLYGSAVDFGVLDTFELNFNSLEEVDEAEFKMVTDNGMPVEIGLQGYFLDENNQVLDSLFSEVEPFIGGAPVDIDGVPTEPNTVVTFVDFPPERFAKIKPAQRLAILANFGTTTKGEQSVQIRAGQDVKVRLGAILGVSN